VLYRDVRPSSSSAHSCPSRFADTLPLIEPIFGRTFIAIFYVLVSVSMRKRISLTITMFDDSSKWPLLFDIAAINESLACIA